MNAAHRWLLLLGAGLTAGVLGGFLFRSFTSDSGAARRQRLAQDSTPGFFPVKLGPQRSGQDRDATDATTWAVRLANNAARGAYGAALFTAKGEKASFDGRSWIWKQRVGFGKGDLEGEVWLSPSGMTEKLDVKLLLYESARKLQR